MTGSKSSDNQFAANNHSAVHRFLGVSCETDSNNNDNPIRASGSSIATASQFPSVCDRCAENVGHDSDAAAAAAISSNDLPLGEIVMGRWEGEESLNDSESPPNRPTNMPLVLSQRSSSDLDTNSCLETSSSSRGAVISYEQRPTVQLALGMEIGTMSSFEEMQEDQCLLPPSYGLESDKVPKKEGMRPELIQDENSVPMPQIVMMAHKQRENIKVPAVTGVPRPVGTEDTIQDPTLQPRTLASAITSVSFTDDEGSTVAQGQSNYHNHIASDSENQTYPQLDYSPNGIAEAYLVEDEVVIALPTKPWWKQRRTHFFAFAVIVILSTSLGIALTRESRVVATQFISVVSTPSPSISAAPSSSLSPSFSPSSCRFTISSNARKLDLLNPEASDPVIAMDGRNLVVASRVVPTTFTVGGGTLVLEFYSLSDANKWERVSDFSESGFDWDDREGELYKNGIDSSGVFVSLSGGTAMVGTPCSGCSRIESVTAYKQNSYGRWERVSDGSPQIPYGCGFGVSAMVDDTLMVTSDFFFCGLQVGPNSAYLFGLFRDKWIEVGDLSNQTYDDDDGSFSGYVRDAAISGNTVVVRMQNSCYSQSDSSCRVDVYRYDPIDESVTQLDESLENILCSGAMSITGDYLVLANHSGVSIFERNDPNTAFRSLQFIDSSDYGEGFGRSLSMDEGILVVGSNNYTHVFSLQEPGRWEEMLVLDQSFDQFQISGSALVAANGTDAVAMNIANCMPHIPTLTPTVSSAPFACYTVEFNFSNFVFEWEPECEIEAMIRKVDGNSIVIETFPLDEGDWDEITMIGLNDESLPNVFDQLTAFSYSKSMCLPHGSYEFILKRQGTMRNVDHYYTVKSYGQMITQGAINPHTWGIIYTETIVFNIPFDGKTTQMRPTMPPSLPSIPDQTWLPTLNETKLNPSLVPESLNVPPARPTLSNPVMGKPHKSSPFPTVHFKTLSPTQSPITSFSELTPSPMSPSTVLK